MIGKTGHILKESGKAAGRLAAAGTEVRPSVYGAALLITLIVIAGLSSLFG